MDNAEKRLIYNNTKLVVDACRKLTEEYQTKYRVKSQLLMDADSDEYQEQLERSYENKDIDDANQKLIDDALKAVKGLKKVLNML